MILALVVLLALFLRLALHRDLAQVGTLKIKGEAALLVALVLVSAFPAIAAIFWPSRQVVLPVWLLLMSVLLGLCLLNARTSHGFRVMAAGVALNICVISANGSMPVSETSAMSVGGAAAAAVVRVGDLYHSVLGPGSRIAILGDVLPLPGFVGLRGVFSVGDILMFAGIAITLASWLPRSQQSR